MIESDLAEALEGLRPGFALVENRFIIVRQRNGELIGIRDSCDEPSISRFPDLTTAVERCTLWLRAFNRNTANFVTQEIPGDVDEVPFMLKSKGW